MGGEWPPYCSSLMESSTRGRASLQEVKEEAQSLHGKNSKLLFLPCKLYACSSSSSLPLKARSAREEQALSPFSSKGPLFEPSQGWGAVLGSVYAHIAPRSACPLEHAEHLCLCMVEMEHGVFWGPEEKTLALGVAREGKRCSPWDVNAVGARGEAPPPLGESGLVPLCLCQALEARQCCVCRHAATSL